MRRDDGMNSKIENVKEGKRSPLLTVLLHLVVIGLEASRTE